MQTKHQTRLPELVAAYEAELTKYGLGFAIRLRWLQRAAAIVHRHEHHEAEYLDSNIISEYIREVDDRFYNGTQTKDHNKTLHREIDRFLWFAKTGEIKLPNPQQGSRQSLTPGFERIAEGYLASEMHPNTRNDARWVTHKYFSWLAEQGYGDLVKVGSVHIQKFILECSSQMSMNSIHDIKDSSREIICLPVRIGTIGIIISGFVIF